MKGQIFLITLIATLILIIGACSRVNPENQTMGPVNKTEVDTRVDTEVDEEDDGSSEDIEFQESDSNEEDNDGWKELFQVDFTAQTHVQVNDLTYYYFDMEDKSTFTYSSRIPDQLSNIIMNTMEESSEQETVDSLLRDTYISQEEFSRLTGVQLENMETIEAYKVDIDNDGSDDIIALHFYGGTGGFSSMDLYKSSSDGRYSLVHSLQCLRQNFGVLPYEGKNYLLLEEFDYNSKFYSGYSLYLYENGTLADGKGFSFAIDDYSMDIVYEDKAFEGIDGIKATLCNAKMPEVLENGEGVIVGNAEVFDSTTFNGFAYSSDIDNDGDLDYYNKSMWYPSNMGTVMTCIYDFEDTTIVDDILTSIVADNEYDRLYTFWIDEVNDVNILYLYIANNMDFSLQALLISNIYQSYQQDVETEKGSILGSQKTERELTSFCIFRL